MAPTPTHRLDWLTGQERLRQVAIRAGLLPAGVAPIVTRAFVDVCVLLLDYAQNAGDCLGDLSTAELAVLRAALDQASESVIAETSRRGL